MKTHPVPQLILVVLLILAFTLPTAAQQPPVDGPKAQPPVDSAPPSPDATPQKAPDGRWFMPAGSRSDLAAATAPQAGGGPDDFGYTWTDTEPLNWLNASGGTDTGINNSTKSAGPIDIGFPFKFYENVRSQAYISLYGFLAFNSDNLGNTHAAIPDPSNPNDVIAPHWVTINDLAGYVHYLNGGSAPDRWFAVEWNRVRSDCCNDAAEEYTFEAILYESGDIVFQYGTMTYDSGHFCQASGVEDTTGLDGLATSRYCQQIAANHAVRITRPAPAARAGLYPKTQGAFGAAGAIVQFDQTVRNTGEFGADTFDFTVSSSWPTTLYQADGSTPLADTDADGTPDTGPLAQGDSTTIVVKIAPPAGATTGDSNAAQVTATPSKNPAIVKTARYQTAIPASFAQTYVSQASWMEPSRAMVGFYRPYQQVTCQTPDQNAWDSVVATAPDGKIVQVWRQSRTNGNGQRVWELYHAVLGGHGNVIRPAARITDLSGATTTVYELDAAVAVAPDGRIGITWRRRLWNSDNGSENNNIYFLMLDGNGATVVAPTNLTNNDGWGNSSTPNVPQFYTPTIAATADGRFGLAWMRQLYDGSSYSTATWYAVRGADGGQVKAPAQFSGSTRSASPNLTPLADGTLFLVLAQLMDNQLGYGRIDRDGNIVTGLTTLSASNPRNPDAVQLPNGNIVLGWSNWNGSKSNIAYAVLNDGLGIVKGLTSLPDISPMNDDYVSVTRSKDWAVLTWLSSFSAFSGQPSFLYYTLLDGGGNIVTPPMTFFRGCAGCTVSAPSNGQGNTPLPEDLTPPANPTGLTSPSHATGAWTNDNTVDVAWTAATDDESGLDGYSVLWDHAPATVPDATKDLGAVTATTGPALTDGDWYFHIRAVDMAGNWVPGAAHLGPFKIDATPPKSAARSPELSAGPIPVTWSGADAGSGIVAYDVWVRDGPAGSWTKWQANTTATSATFASPVVGHTYYFRSVARDAAGNVETDLPPDGDSHTTATIQVTGKILNNRHQPVFNATVSTQPAALNVAHTDGSGRYVLYLTSSGVFDVTAARAGYGTLPARHDLAVSSNVSDLDFVLPPENDLVVNGGWETGNLTGWKSEPGAAVAVEAAAAHTGLNGLRLNSPVTVAGPAGIPAFWQLSQIITLPAELTEPTLSWLYRIASGVPTDSLLIQVTDGTADITRQIPLTPSGWTHAWMDLSAFSGQTVTLRIGFLEASAREVYLDEVSIGATRVGVYPVRLPLIAR